MNKRKQRLSKILDISPALSEHSPVWPGDVALSRQWHLRLENGESVNLSSIQTTVHIGAHADAPSHYSDEGISIDEVGLSAYLGRCFVLDLSKVKEKEIKPDHLSRISDLSIERVLFKTNSFDSTKEFNSDFSYFRKDTIDLLGEKGVVLMGIDTPSFDAFDSKDLKSHNALLKNNIRNLEGLDLKDITEGFYELIALPLKLKGFDGSPVRAILKTI